MIELSLDPGAYVSRALRGGQDSIEDDLGYPGGCLNLDRQDVRLRREEHPQLQLLGGHLVGDGLCGLDEHFIGYALRLRSVNGHADGGEDIQVVSLRRQGRLPAEGHRGEMETHSLDNSSPCARTNVPLQEYSFLSRARKGREKFSCHFSRK